MKQRSKLKSNLKSRLKTGFGSLQKKKSEWLPHDQWVAQQDGIADDELKALAKRKRESAIRAKITMSDAQRQRYEAIRQWEEEGIPVNAYPKHVINHIPDVAELFPELWQAIAGLVMPYNHELLDMEYPKSSPVHAQQIELDEILKAMRKPWGCK